MKKLLFFATLFSVFIIAKYDKPTANNDFDQRLLWKSQHAQKNISSRFTSNRFQRGKITALTDNSSLSESKMHEIVERYSKGYPERSSYILKWRDSAGKTISLSALGIDWQHHFANSYLVGFRPFAVENKWLPLYAIAQLKTYQTDDLQYGVPEMWQNSAQAYVTPRGDCEDHALILADWLIAEGIDARVVAGSYKGGGHAWVVAIIDDKEFILEATSKRKYNNWNHYPLASLAQEYRPEFMFNRQQFWLNNNLHITDNYRGTHWQEVSHFTP
ncbi:transglutaminase domain-containing protein [Thalassotalea ganghwensis]